MKNRPLDNVKKSWKWRALRRRADRYKDRVQMVCEVLERELSKDLKAELAKRLANELSQQGATQDGQV